MDTLVQTTGRALYEADEHAWLERQIEVLREGRFHEVGRESRAACLEDTGRQGVRDLRSHVAMLSQHLLKIACQPERHARSWNLPVRTQHQEVREILRDSPSLAARPDSLVSDAYNAAETERALGTAPAACPWPADEARAFVPPEPPPRRPQPRFAR